MFIFHIINKRAKNRWKHKRNALDIEVFLGSYKALLIHRETCRGKIRYYDIYFYKISMAS